MRNGPARERRARRRPGGGRGAQTQHKAARRLPGCRTSLRPPLAPRARANTMHPGLGPGGSNTEPRDFLVNSSPCPRPHPHPRRPGFRRCPSPTPPPPLLKEPGGGGSGEVGTPGGRGPRTGARGRGEGQRGEMGSGRETAPKEEFAFAPGVEKKPSSGSELPGKRRLERLSGAPGQPRSAASKPLARASDKAPLTRAPLCVCIFFPSSRARHRAPGRLLPLPRPPPPFPGRITFPGLRSGSRGCLQRPTSKRSIAEQPEPAGGARGARGGGEGRGRARTFDPEGPAAGWGGGPGARREREAGGGGRKDSSSLDLGRERAWGRGEGARARRAGGNESGAVTGTATGVKGAELQEAGRPRRRSVRAPRRDPAPSRAPAAAPARWSPHWRPEAPGLREEAGAKGEAGSLLVLPGQAGGRKLSCKFIIKSVISVKMIGDRRGATEPQENKGSFPSKWASSAKGTPRAQAPPPADLPGAVWSPGTAPGRRACLGARRAARALRRNGGGRPWVSSRLRA